MKKPKFRKTLNPPYGCRLRRRRTQRCRPRRLTRKRKQIRLWNHQSQRMAFQLIIYLTRVCPNYTLITQSYSIIRAYLEYKSYDPQFVNLSYSSWSPWQTELEGRFDNLFIGVYHRRVAWDPEADYNSISRHSTAS